MKFPYCSRSSDVALHSADAIAAGTIQPPAVPGYLLISSSRFCREAISRYSRKKTLLEQITIRGAKRETKALLDSVWVQTKQSQTPTHTYSSLFHLYTGVGLDSKSLKRKCPCMETATQRLSWGDSASSSRVWHFVKTEGHRQRTHSL